MKKLLLPLICLLALAAPSFAEEDQASTTSGSFASPETMRKHRPPADDVPVAPVPEPGTMALASMGLIALGAAARQRRNK